MTQLAPTSATQATRHSRLYLAISLLVVAANLRPTITSVGSVMSDIGSDLDLGPTALGVLGAIPLLSFGFVALVVHRIFGRFGSERVVFGALLVLIAGTVLRYTAGPAGLWVGSVLGGSGIGVLNVLVSALVKREFPSKIATMTGAYSAVLLAAAAIASGIAVPIASRTNWQFAISVWVVLAVIAVLIWVPRLRVRNQKSMTAPPAATTPMWKSAVAWQVTLFMAFQGLSNYFLITWLPTIQLEFGVPLVTGGVQLFAMQLAAIVTGMLIPLLMREAKTMLAACLASAMMVLALLGIAFVPSLDVVWVILAGLSSGAALVIALTLAALRAATPADAAKLSGMAQGVGYLLAAIGPVGAGFLYSATRSWQVVLVTVALVAIAQLIVGVLASRDRLAI